MGFLSLARLHSKVRACYRRQAYAAAAAAHKTFLKKARAQPECARRIRPNRRTWLPFFDIPRLVAREPTIS